ncbi:MAG: cysteine hydrolase family protein [Stackebrandtia sp.]
MTNALIVIDVQESFRQRPNWSAMSRPDIAARVARLVEHTRDRGEHIVWILHTEPGTDNVFDPGMGHVRLLDGLTPRDAEPVLTKTSVNSFTTTNLAQRLTLWGVDEVTVCGIRTEQCCETTARVASDLGYRVNFVSDATATTPIEHPQAPAGRALDAILADPLTLSAAEITARTEYILAGRGFATVTTLDEATAAGSAG